VLLLVAALAVLLTIPATASATFPGENGLLAVSELQGDGSGDCGDGIHNSCGFLYGNVFTLPGRHRITPCKPDPEVDCVPEGVSWAPHGRRVAYDLNADIFVARPDGTHRRRIVSGGTHPAWSPDGREIAYGGDRGIYRVRIRGGKTYRLTNGIVDDDPDWSSNGTIAFDRPLHQGDVNTDLFSVRPDGEGLTRLTRTDAREPSWSPGGRKLAYAHANHVFVVGAHGGKRRVLPLQGYAGSPAWSPDGRLLAVGRSYGIATVRANGDLVSERRLPWGAPFDAAWQARGRR
jgi:Tol biopolymer transport system component